MKEQLHKLMDAEGMGPARFADEIGVQRSSISHILSGRNKPSYDFIMKIMDRFKGINAEWLLTGQGSMIKGQEIANNRRYEGDDLFSNEQTSQNNQLNISPVSQNSNTGTISQNHESPDSNTELKTEEKKSPAISKFTNVNNVNYILVFYEDGSFKQYNPREL